MPLHRHKTPSIDMHIPSAEDLPGFALMQVRARLRTACLPAVDEAP